MNLYVGTSGFKYKPWKGSFYPAKLPDKQMLRYYGEQFRAVEVNYTFRTMPKPATLEGWAADVPAGFRIVLKVPMRITHVLRLKNADDAVKELLDAAEVLKDRLGPLLVQLPPNMAKDVPRLRTFLDLLTCRAAFEFRHASWFDEEVFGVLREHRASLCIAEADNDLEVPFAATADWGYLRLRMPDYTDAELRSWAKRVKGIGWQEAFVFFKHEDEGKGPRLAKRFLELAG
jgi:uncharacterized protein YecE (DUF72 family)